MVLKPYFHSFPEIWSVQECGSDYGAHSGLPKIFGKIPASSLPGNTQVDLRKISQHDPKTQCGWDCMGFCLVPSGQKSWQLPGAPKPCVQQATSNCSFMSWRHYTRWLRISSYTITDTPRWEYAGLTSLQGYRGAKNHPEETHIQV